MTAPANGSSNELALPLVPQNYVAEREDYHRVAYAVVSEARRVVTGRIGLRAIPGGFGTPLFGESQRVGVVGTKIIRHSGGTEASAELKTLASAGAFVGVSPSDTQAEHDTVALGDINRALEVSAATGEFLASWFAFGTSALETTLALADASDDPAEIQLWPGHFDAATEIGSADAGQRATFGASPGDATHPEPYVYVGAWADIDAENPYWNAKGFTGASLGYQELLDSPDPMEAATSFFATGYGLLHAAG